MTDEDRSIAYMSRSWASSSFPEYQFLGFVPTIDYHWGTMIHGKQQCAVHIFRTHPVPWVWGGDKRETEELSVRCPYVLMFYGIDNSSYFMRFATLQEGLDVYEIVKDGVRYNEDGMMFYNS